MNEKDKYIEARDNSIAKLYLEFDLCKNNNPNAFFAFFEGKDAPYYSMRIERISNKEVEPIKCKGKSNVKGIYKYLSKKNEYNRYSTGFFINKDYDDNELEYINNNFYVTPCYAIENFYCNDKCLERILKCELGYNSSDEDFQKIKEDYLKFQNSYNASILLFNSWYFAVKRKSHELKLSLDKELPKGYLQYNLEDRSVTQLYCINSIFNDFKDKAPIPNEDELNHAKEQISRDLVQNLRGKYEMHCLVVFLQRIIEELKGGKPSCLKKKKVNLNIGDNNAISILAQYAEESDSLQEYVIKRIK